MSVSISVSPVVVPELSLTSHNLSTVLDSMDDGLWWEFSHHINISESEVKRIWSKFSSDKECKQAAIDYLISSHPAPSWRLVANTLYQMVIWTGNHSSHRALACLQQLFPTGTCCGFGIHQICTDVRYNRKIHLHVHVCTKKHVPVYLYMCTCLKL